VGQTGRCIKARFKEHRKAFKTNSHTSNFAKHLTEQSHSFNSIQNTMQILKCHSKGTHLNTIERYYIYAENIKHNHLKDEHAITPNRIFEVLLKPQPP
jgi:hypothetical protein